VATFPKLKTGALAQFGSSRETQFYTEVLRFVDGSEQRMVQRRAQVRWHLRFDQLSEEEVRSIVDFFQEHQGPVAGFQFEDPWTGEVVETCVFDTDEIEIQWVGPNHARTAVRIRSKAGL
jgi:hypothetical protein